MLRFPRTYRILALSALSFSVAVVLWGAFVRATGAGAGCGDHWPTCNGTILPHSPGVKTLIEFTHRFTTGLLLLLLAALLVSAFRSFPKGHPARRASVLSAFFLVTEALIGAGLVLLKLVADNPSVARAYWMGAHQANTFLLLAALALAVWHGWGDARPRFAGPWRWRLAGLWMLLPLVAVSGAVAALGNTLFPAASLADGLRQDLSPGAHVLIRLRVWHPVLAILAAAYLLWTVLALLLDDRRGGAERNPAARRLAPWVGALVATQVLAGFTNLLLLAPVWTQLVHLFLADAVWVSTILLSAAVLSSPKGAA